MKPTPDSFNGNAKTASTMQYVKQDTPSMYVTITAIYDIITLINEDGGWGSAFQDITSSEAWCTGRVLGFGSFMNAFYEAKRTFNLV